MTSSSEGFLKKNNVFHCNDPSFQYGDPLFICSDPSFQCGDPSFNCGDPSFQCGYIASHSWECTSNYQRVSLMDITFI